MLTQRVLGIWSGRSNSERRRPWARSRYCRIACTVPAKVRTRRLSSVVQLDQRRAHKPLQSLAQCVGQAFAHEQNAGTGKHTLLVLDGAGWHNATPVEPPDGIELVVQPPYSPEVQPAEHLWEIADEGLAIRCFDTFADLEETLARRCCALMEQAEHIMRRALFAWWLIRVVQHHSIPDETVSRMKHPHLSSVAVDRPLLMEPCRIAVPNGQVGMCLSTAVCAVATLRSCFATTIFTGSSCDPWKKASAQSCAPLDCGHLCLLDSTPGCRSWWYARRRGRATPERLPRPSSIRSRILARERVGELYASVARCEVTPLLMKENEAGRPRDVRLFRPQAQMPKLGRVPNLVQELGWRHDLALRREGAQFPSAWVS